MSWKQPALLWLLVAVGGLVSVLLRACVSPIH